MDPTNTQASATSTRSAAGEERAAVSVTYVDCGTTAPTYCGVIFLKKKFNCFENLVN